MDTAEWGHGLPIHCVNDTRIFFEPDANINLRSDFMPGVGTRHIGWLLVNCEIWIWWLNTTILVPDMAPLLSLYGVKKWLCDVLKCATRRLISYGLREQHYPAPSSNQEHLSQPSSSAPYDNISQCPGPPYPQS